VRSSYSFSASWVTPAPVAEVARVVTDLEHYPEWWPQVRAVAKIDDDTARVLCRSALPYTLDLVLQAVSREAPLLEVRLGGDLDGWVRWHLTEDPGGTRTEFTQEVSVGGALALASYAARPLLAWNHHRMMAGCEAGLARRLSGPPR
jgi:uncharacterized protein YndB with AHSA1/START domain